MPLLTDEQIESIRESIYTSWDTCSNCMPWDGGEPVWIVGHEDLDEALCEAIHDCYPNLGFDPYDYMDELLSELELCCPTCGTDWDSLPMEIGRPIASDNTKDNEVTIAVPRLNDKKQDFEHLFGMWQDTLGYGKVVTFEFSHCYFLRPNAVAFLGGLARLIWSRLGLVFFDWDSLTNNAVRANLEQSGFFHEFTKQRGPWTGNSIPYREDRTENANDYADYLSDMWLGRGWVHVSDALKDAIVERVLELYVNAFEHSASEVGVFTCGQYFPHRGQLTLAIADFGLGIPATVRRYWQLHKPGHGMERLLASDCLKWAFSSGSTTKPNGTGRGMGLDLLKAFIITNNGRLEIYSNEGYALISANGETYADLGVSFEGTVAYITLNCDEKHYRLTSERG